MLKRCPICGKPIEVASKQCKHCKSHIIDINTNFVWQNDPGRYNKNFKFTKKFWIYSFIISILVFIGIYLHPALTDERDWKYAIELNNRKAYKEYIDNHKYGNHINEAWNILDKCCWQKTIEQNTEKAYLFYLAKFPSGKYKNVAKRNADELAWKKACESNDIPLIKKYIKNYPHGIFIDCAKLKLKETITSN